MHFYCFIYFNFVAFIRICLVVSLYYVVSPFLTKLPEVIQISRPCLCQYTWGKSNTISKVRITEYYTIYTESSPCLNFGICCLETKQPSKPFQDSVFRSLLTYTLLFLKSIFIYLLIFSPCRL